MRFGVGKKHQMTIICFTRIDRESYNVFIDQTFNPLSSMSVAIRPSRRESSGQQGPQYWFRWAILALGSLLCVVQLLESGKRASACFLDYYLQDSPTSSGSGSHHEAQVAQWFEHVTGGSTATKCPSVFAKVQSGLWADPNDGKLLYRKVVSEPHFLMSLHSQAYDNTRYGSIYVKGQYYEDEVRQRFEYILNETHWDYESSSSLPMVLDIGGNIGFYTFLSAAWQHAVVTFEINPANILRICESLHLNTQNPQIGMNPSINHTMRVQLYQQGMSNVTGNSFRVAVPGNPGATELPPSGASSVTRDTSRASAREFSVTTITLDDFARDRGWFETRPYIAIAKIDTEGHEPQILQGGLNVFKAHFVQNVLVEYRVITWEMVQRILLDQGYVVVEHDVRTKKITQLNRTESFHYMTELTAKMTRRGKSFPFCDVWFRLEHLPAVRGFL